MAALEPPRWRVTIVGFAVAATCLAGACAGRFPPCPASGGPTWRDLSSDHFRLRTEVDEPDARATLQDLESLESAVLTGFGAAPGIRTGHVPVVMIDRGWSEFADADIEGVFTHVLFQPLIVLRAGNPPQRQETIKHELVHYLSSLVIPVQPLWLAEGLATYFETLEYDSQKSSVTVGRPPAQLLAYIQRTSPFPLEEMMRATEILPDQRAGFYATAWLTVHFLMNHHRDAFLAYERALAGGSHSADAWQGAFGTLTAGGLETEVRNYVDGGEYELLTYPLAAAAHQEAQVRPMADADVHVTRALLILAGRRNGERHVPDAGVAAELGERGKRELAEAFRQNPSHAQGQAVAHWMLQAPIVLEQARAARDRDPQDWLAWVLLHEGLRASGSAEEQAEALRKALELAAEDRSVTLVERPAQPHP